MTNVVSLCPSKYMLSAVRNISPSSFEPIISVCLVPLLVCICLGQCLCLPVRLYQILLLLMMPKLLFPDKMHKTSCRYISLFFKQRLAQADYFRFSFSELPLLVHPSVHHHNWPVIQCQKNHSVILSFPRLTATVVLGVWVYLCMTIKTKVIHTH